MGRKSAEPRPKAQRNVVGIEESDELSSEQGGDHAHTRKRQRGEDAAASQLGSKRAHQTQPPPDASAAAGADAGGDADEPMEEQQQQRQQVPPQDSPQQDQPEQDQPQQQLQRRRSTSAGSAAAAAAAAAAHGSDGGTPFTAQAAFTSAFPEQQQDDTPPGATAAAAAPSGGPGEGGSGGKQGGRPKRQPKPRKAPGLANQPSGFSGPWLGTRLSKGRLAKSASKDLWPGPVTKGWGKGSDERPDEAAPNPPPQGEAAMGWGVWVCYTDKDAKTDKESKTWWRGVVTCYEPQGWDGNGEAQYQVAMEDGDVMEDSCENIKNDPDFVFAYPPKAASVPAPLSQQPSLPAAEEEAAPDDAAAAQEAAPPAAPAAAQAKPKARGRASQQQPKAALAAGGDAAAEAAAGEPDAEQQPGGSGAHAKKQQPKQQQQRKLSAQQKPAPLRAGTPTSPGPPSARPAAPPPLDLSRRNLSDRAAKLARCLQQLQAADQQVAQGLQKQAAALTELLAINPDFATGKEVKEAGGGELLQTLARFKGLADRLAPQLGELDGMAWRARSCMQGQGQQRGAMPGGNTPAAAAAAAGRSGDAAAALAAAKQQLARAQSERAAAEKAAAEARAAAEAEAANCEAARVAAAAAEERLAELGSFASRLKLLVPLEALEDGSPVRAKAVALLASVLLPPVAVSPFQAASELEGMLFRGYGLVGAGKDMYLKHLYMIWSMLGGRELAAAAEASSEAARAAEEAAAAARGGVQPGEPDAAADVDVDAQVKQQAAAAALAKAQEVLAGAPGVADAATVRNALLDGSATVSEIFQLTCSKLGFDKQRDK